MAKICTARIFSACKTLPATGFRMRISMLGDSALIVEAGSAIDVATHEKVQAVFRALEKPALPAIVELVPAFTTVTLFYDPVRAVEAGAPADRVTHWMERQVAHRLAKLGAATSPADRRTVEIPICYDRDFGPDMAELSEATGLAADEIVRRHAGADYLVYLLGFAPGFPYMGGLPAELSRPRRAVPRTRVAPGSVGVVGTQCCIYPIETPAGWNIIGRTPLRLFHLENDPPALLRPGDRVRFRPVSRAEFLDLEGK